jgi:hypothetical protein
MAAQKQMPEFMGSYRPQKTRQWRAELSVKLLYAVEEYVTVFAKSILLQKGQTENRVGRRFSLGNDVQHKVVVARSTTASVVDPVSTSDAINPRDLDSGGAKDSRRLALRLLQGR